MDAPKVHLTREDVLDLTNNALAISSHHHCPKPVDPIPPGVEEGSEHACWLLNEVFVLRARSLASTETDRPRQEDVLVSLRIEARIKDIIREEALAESQSNDTLISKCIPVSVANGTWRRNAQLLDIASDVVMYSIEERKYGAPLDTRPQITPTDSHLQGIVSSHSIKGLCNLLSLLQRPSLVEQAYAIGVRMHEAINLNKIALESHEILDKFIKEATQKRDTEIETYMTWQRKLAWEDCLSICTEVASSMQIPDLDLQSREERTEDVVLLHADLKGEHILVEGDGSVSGVLDWTDAALGPGYIDIAGLVISVGAPLSIEIALRAGYGLHSCSKGILFARSRSVLYLHNKEGPQWLIERQAQRAFEDMESRSKT